MKVIACDSSGARHRLVACSLAAALAMAAHGRAQEAAPVPAAQAPAAPRCIDLDADGRRQIVVDRDKTEYLGHVSTVLLADERTIIAVYPKGHGRGPIVMKTSTDGGRTWSKRREPGKGLPANWADSKETPTIFALARGGGSEDRLVLFSGLYPGMVATSDDSGTTWTDLKPVGDWGGIVMMGSVEPISGGRAMAFWHDDGRFLHAAGKVAPTMTLLSSTTADAGLTWSQPRVVFEDSAVHLCEPGAVRSPDGAELSLLLRENRRVKQSHVMSTRDEGETWTKPRELNPALTGDRHTARYAPDGRLVVSFRDMAEGSPTRGDWIAWVGTYDDVTGAKPGQYRVRLKDNKDAWDCGYPGVSILPDGTVVCVTYGHWDEGKPPYILCVRFSLGELDAIAAPGGAAPR